MLSPSNRASIVITVNGKGAKDMGCLIEAVFVKDWEMCRLFSLAYFLPLLSLSAFKIICVIRWLSLLKLRAVSSIFPSAFTKLKYCCWNLAGSYIRGFQAGNTMEEQKVEKRSANRLTFNISCYVNYMKTWCILSLVIWVLLRYKNKCTVALAWMLYSTIFSLKFHQNQL